MADSSWFRMIGNPRHHRATAKAPEHDIETCTPSEQAQHPDIATRSVSDQAHERHRVQLQPTKTLLGLPSWQSLTHGHVHGHGHYSSADISGGDDDALVVKEEDRVWQKPSVDQMADTLLSALMVKPATEPLGPENCSLALHVLEAYRESHFKMAELEKELVQEKERRQRLSDDYNALGSNWMIEEETYKAEIKRLELIIAKDGGTAAVQIARSASLLDRRSRSRSSQSNFMDFRIGTVNRGHIGKAEATRETPLVRQTSNSVVAHRRRISSHDETERYNPVEGSAIHHPPNPKLGGGHVRQYSVGEIVAREQEDRHQSASGSATRVYFRDRPIDSSSSSSDEALEYTEADQYLRPSSHARRSAALSRASSASTVRIHRRDFSFQAGDDGFEVSKFPGEVSG